MKPLSKKQLGGKKSIGGGLTPSGRMVLNTGLGGGRIGISE